MPGPAEVKMNEWADAHAAATEDATILNLYPAYVKILGNYALAQQTRSLLANHS